MAQEVRRYKAFYDVDVEDVVEYETEDKVELFQIQEASMESW